MYIPWLFPPVWGVADNTKETTKTMGISLRSSSNDEGPSRVWTTLLEQHSPFSPVFHNLRRFIDAISPTSPTTGLPKAYETIRRPRGTADANQNCATIIRHSFLFLAHSLASLKSILLSFRALFTPSIHPNLGLSFLSHTKPTHPSPFYQTNIQSHTFCSLLYYNPTHSNTTQLEFREKLTSPQLPLFRAVSEEFYTGGGDSQSPRPVSFSRLLQHAENTLTLFFCYVRHHRANK